MIFSLKSFWASLNISLKIIFPFLAVCLSVLILGLLTTGHWLTSSLEQTLSEEVKNFAERIYEDFQQEEKNLENQIKLIADRESIRIAIEKQDRGELLKILLPLRTGLSLDLIKVVDNKGKVLLDARDSELVQAKLLDSAIVDIAISGSTFAEFLDVEGGRQILQTFIHPVKSSAGLVGGIMIAKSVNDQLLQKFTAGSYKDLIAVRNGKMISTTISSIRQSTALNITDMFASNLTINNQRYLSKNISLKGASQEISVIVLAPTVQLDADKSLLWIRFGFVFFFGAIIVILVGFLTSEAITRPLKIVSQVARKVTQDNNFKLQVPVITKDEIGVVAVSLNQLIHQVRELLIEQEESKEQLEIYNQTLEEQVVNRTEEIYQKNVALKKTFQQLKDAQLQLVQSEKMSALGQLVAGVAHEINNPVNFIYGNLTYIDQYTQDLMRLLNAYQTEYPHPSQSIQDDLEEVNLDFLREDLTKILKSMKFGSERIRDIVLSLRNFSRLDESEFKPIDIHEGIDNTLMILQHRLKATDKRPEIEIVKHYGDIPLVVCSGGQINQVFMNLLTNAIDAMEEREEQQSFQDFENNPNRIVISTVQTASNAVQIKIADNGMGISEEIQSRLFDPFFTTKPVGKGTGLGLSISYQVVTEKHGGKIWCDSVLGKGTTFVIELPLSPLQS